MAKTFEKYLFPFCLQKIIGKEEKFKGIFPFDGHSGHGRLLTDLGLSFSNSPYVFMYDTTALWKVTSFLKSGQSFISFQTNGILDLCIRELASC